MSSEMCIHEVREDSCGICRKLPDEGWEAVARFEAEYGGWCADISCSEPIVVGDEIVRWTEGGYSAYTHGGCRP